jgi:hypothetical protein
MIARVLLLSSTSSTFSGFGDGGGDAAGNRPLAMVAKRRTTPGPVRGPPLRRQSPPPLSPSPTAQA